MPTAPFPADFSVGLSATLSRNGRVYFAADQAAESSATTSVLMPSVPPDPYESLAQRFVDHYDLLRGLVRYKLAARQLDLHLPPPPASVIDVGGGAGHQALRLAERGYHVVLADPSDEMLRRAAERLGAVDPAIRERVELVQADAQRCVELYPVGAFDAVLCHGVVMYLPSTEPVVEVLASLARADGVVSLIAKNGDALAMRAALERRYADAITLFDANADLGRVGVVTRGDSLESLTAMFERHALSVIAWYGIRTFTDHLGDEPVGNDSELAVEAEWRAGQTDPYRQVARLLHLVGQHTSC
jgi:S-adenosylmethionine-dependent methyltransferase